MSCDPLNETEELYRNEYNSLAEARIGWQSYRDWYRNDRLHQSLRHLCSLKHAMLAEKSIFCVARFPPA